MRPVLNCHAVFAPPASYWKLADQSNGNSRLTDAAAHADNCRCDDGWFGMPFIATHRGGIGPRLAVNIQPADIGCASFAQAGRVAHEANPIRLKDGIAADIASTKWQWS